MTALTDRLATHLGKMASGDISESTMHRCMALLRELLEERNERPKYPAIALFCDWLLHAKLNRSGGDLLDILDTFWALGKDINTQMVQLIQAFSPLALRDEIVRLLDSALLDSSVFLNISTCEEFMSHLTADLRDKPIERPAANLAKRTSGRLAQGYWYIADRISFQKNEQGNELVLVARQIESASGGEARIVIPWPVLAWWER
jgi:hypothetical protein